MGAGYWYVDESAAFVGSAGYVEYVDCVVLDEVVGECWPRDED